MNSTTTIGLDLAKSVFQVHGVDASSTPTIKRQLKRKDVLAFFARTPRCLVGLEACGTAHHWARELGRLGHTVRLLPPTDVKPYVRRGKTDAADAEAICEAVTRPRHKSVPVKTIDQQCALMVHSVRQQMIGQRTAQMNAIRSHLAELGLIEREGREGMERLLTQLRDETCDDIPPLARQVLSGLAELLAVTEARIDALDALIRAQSKVDPVSRRLQTIPGVGPLAASAFAATVSDPQAFRNGRAFAAALGITPKLDGTGGKVRTGAITKKGNRYLRRLLYLGAMARLLWAKRRPDRAAPALLGLLARLPIRKAAMALANKTARIIWVLLARGGTYVNNHLPTAYAAPA